MAKFRKKSVEIEAVIIEAVQWNKNTRKMFDFLTNSKDLSFPLRLQIAFRRIKRTLNQKQCMEIATNNLFNFSMSELCKMRINNLEIIFHLSQFNIVFHFCVINLSQNCINLRILEVDLKLSSLVINFSRLRLR